MLGATSRMQDNELFSITLGEDQIIRILYGYQRRITLELVKSVVSQSSQLITIKHPLIVAGPNIVYLDYDAAKYQASQEPAELFTAVAVITKTRLEQTLGRMFLRIHKPHFPVRLFTSEAEAEKWVLIYLPSKSAQSKPTPLVYV